MVMIDAAELAVHRATVESTFDSTVAITHPGTVGTTPHGGNTNVPGATFTDVPCHWGQPTRSSEIEAAERYELQNPLVLIVAHDQALPLGGEVVMDGGAASGQIVGHVGAGTWELSTVALVEGNPT